MANFIHAAYVVVHKMALDAILKEVWASGRVACVPALRAEKGVYEMALLAEGDPVIEGACRVPEPKEKQWVRLGDIGLLVVAGVAFDVAGGRVGHGGGHYDRMLSTEGGSHTIKVGLAFDFQVLDRVPTGDKDILMDMVISDGEVLRVKTNVASVVVS